MDVESDFRLGFNPIYPKKNNREGYGIMTYPDRGKYQEGSRYEGQWKNDKRDGQGIMTYLDDVRRLEGKFEDNVFIGEK